MAKQKKMSKRQKRNQIIAGVVCVLLILAMILPMFLGSF